MEIERIDGKKKVRTVKMKREKAMQMLMKLLLNPAIDAPGKGWRINGFGLILMAIVLTVGLLKAPGSFVTGGAVAGSVWKIVRHMQITELSKKASERAVAKHDP
jgi:hypothetical protein